MSQQSTLPSQLSKLRGVVRDALDKHLYESAIFFADKLLTLSNNELEDLHLLAQAYYETNQYRRAIHVLQKVDKLDQNCKYLVAKCKSKLGDWDGVIEILSDQFSAVSQPNDADKSILAAMHVLLGQAYEAVDQRSRAAQCYRIAVKIDIMCYEAFQRLVDGFMQTSAEEAELLQSLSFPPDMPWLEHVYRAKIKRFVDQLPLRAGRGTSIEETYSRIQEAYGLNKNDDLLQSKAEDFIYCNQPQKAYEITKKALERDPFNYGSLLLVHVAALVAMQNKSELFYLAHKIVEENPKLPIGWYIVGCYYFTIKNYPQARRYIHKATVLDKDFGAAWLAFGHVFAAEAEPDQALAAYRTAARLLVGSHIPPLCISMELIRSNNPSLALDFAVKAYKMRSEDPLILNEIGVCLIRGNQFEKAADHFVRALDSVGARVTEFWEPTLFNLGHCYRKMRQYDLAAKYYSTALGLSPHNPSTHTALGLTCHLQGKLDQAIEHYHTALGLQPEDPTFASDLLKRALEESLADIVPITQTFGPLAGQTEPLAVEPGSSIDMEPEDDDV